LVFGRVGRHEPPQILPSDLSQAHEPSLQPGTIDNTHIFLDQNGHRERQRKEKTEREKKLKCLIRCTKRLLDYTSILKRLKMSFQSVFM